MLNGSGVSREVPAPFYEGPEGKFLWSTLHKLHWHLDVSFNEDKSRIKAGNGAENFSLLKRCVLNLVKADTSEKASVTLKRRMAGWDPAYRLKLLGVK